MSFSTFRPQPLLFIQMMKQINPTLRKRLLHGLIPKLLGDQVIPVVRPSRRSHCEAAFWSIFGEAAESLSCSKSYDL